MARAPYIYAVYSMRTRVQALPWRTAYILMAISVGSEAGVGPVSSRDKDYAKIAAEYRERGFAVV